MAEPSSSQRVRIACLITALTRPYTGYESRELPSSIRELVSICRQLGLLSIRKCRPDDPSDRQVYLETHYKWQVSFAHISKLDSLPQIYPHSGTFEWVGTEAVGLPKWLWDSQMSTTVATKAEHLRHGYMAISYTWGRWKCGTRAGEGPAWEVPIIEPKVCNDMLGSLKQIMSEVPHSRYFWVDVLCINQDDEAEKLEEIKKISSIFGNAKQVLVYLWTLEANDDLAQVLSNIGDLILWALRFGDENESDQSANQARLSELSGSPRLPKHYQKLMDAKFRLEPWFSSLWTLQEMVVAPSSIWITRYGDIASVNGLTLTTRLLALSMNLLSKCLDARREIWESLQVKFNAPAEDEFEDADLFVQQTLRRVSGEDTGNQSSVRLDVLGRCEEMDERFTGIRQKEVHVFMATSAQSAEPWVKKLWYKEISHREDAARWVDWATGEACIDVALECARRQILIAASNRYSTGNRAQAVVAALKIAWQPEFGDENALCHDGFPVALINTLLRTDGSSLLLANHWFRVSTDIRSSESPLFIERNPTDVEYIFSGLLPTRGTKRHPLVIDWDYYNSIDLQHWHVHRDGSIHIPHGAVTHNSEFFSLTEATFWSNGSQAGTTFLSTFEILTLVGWHTATSMPSTIEKPFDGICHVLLLPLMFLDKKHANKARIRHELSYLPEVVGVVLVGNAELKRDDSMTYWSKYGLYASASFSPGLLAWQDGILVGPRGLYDEPPVRQKELCPFHALCTGSLGPKILLSAYERIYHRSRRQLGNTLMWVLFLSGAIRRCLMILKANIFKLGRSFRRPNQREGQDPTALSEVEDDVD